MRDQLLAVVREVAGELRGGRRGPAVGLDSKLDADLGLDSLGRIELLMRLQRRLGVSIGEEQALAAETPRQLLAAVQAAARAAPAPGAGAVTPAARVEPEPPPALPTDATTLAAALHWFADEQPDRVHIELYERGEDPVPVTHAELRAEARRVAAGLSDAGLERGASVALMLPTSRDFFVAFAGVWLAGGVPVPIYPPFRASQLEEHLRRQALILENARAAVLITSPETARPGRWLRAALPGLRQVTTVAELAARGGGSPIPPVAVRPEDVALVQYTSGSTGDPKGVVLTHANLLANVRALGAAASVQPADVFVSWLPLYHDMGLIGAWFGSLYHGCRLVVMPPTRFLTRPQAWLQAIHRHRGTLSAAPNFAYEICASRLADEDLVGLDLGCWRLAVNGSEPVSARTLDRFARRLAPHGFRAEAMTPVYGLAEDSVGLSFPPLGRGPRLDRVARAAFERERRALPAAPAPAAGEGEPLVFVSGGAPLPGHEIRIVDDAGHELPDRREGQVEFRGPSATRGYLRNERATRALRDGDWLRTGDLGYVAEGELFVTGRNKDVIIRAGRHVFPYELEELVGGVPGVRRGGVAVFAHASHEGGTEKLVVVAETRLGADDDRQRAALRGRIEGQAAALLGAAPDEIVLAPPRTVPKTSSGKIRRAACRDLYLRGQLGARPSVRRQVVALAAHALVPLGRRTFQRLGALAYAVWFWACWAALAVPAWVLALAVPGGRARWRAVSAVARAFFAAAGIRVDLEGRARLAARPSVLVLNHASNLDSMALLAVLPPGFSFVAKRELARNPLLRPALRRLGVVLVERFDPQRSVEDAARMEATLRAGRSLVVFPEGTNRRIPGLFPFHLGAFLAAAQTGAPLVPAGITGTRAVLRPDQSFPRRSDAPIRIAVLPALAAGAGSWSAAVALRDGARRAIAGATGETLVG